MLILEKNIFEQFVAKFFENIEIISGVIIPIAAHSKTFYYHYLFIYLFFFVILQGMTVPNFMSKVFCY